MPGKSCAYAIPLSTFPFLYRLRLLPFLLICLTLTCYGQSVQLQFNTLVNVPNTSSVATCSSINLDMSYGVVSPTTSAMNARIIVPLNGFTFVSVGSNPNVASSQVVGTAPNDTLVIAMVSPLAAGSAGNVSVQLQFPCGTTCSGQTGSLQARFTAANASTPINGSVTSLTATAVNPNYQVNVVQSSYNASTRRAVYTVRVTPTTSPANFMPLDSPVLSMTAPAGVIIRQVGTGGTRTSIPNGLPSSNFTPVSTTGVSGGNPTFTWTNIPIFHRGGQLNINNIELEFPAAQFPYGTVVSFASSLSGVLGTGGCSGPTSDTGLNTFTLSAPGSVTAGATGCAGQQMITGLNNPWNAVFAGKRNQTRISVPISNTGNVALSNLTYTIAIPTNQLSATQVSGTGSSGVSGQAFYRTNLNPTYVSVGTVGQGITTRTFPTTLATGEYITEVRVTVTTIAAGSNMTVNVFGNQLSPLRDGSAVNAAPLTTFMASTTAQNSCFGGYTCLTAEATVTAEYNGALILNQTCTSSRVVVQPSAAGVQNLSKALTTTPSSYVPGQVYQYRIRFTPVTAGDTLRNFVVTDALPARLEFAGNVKYSNTTTAPATGAGSFSASGTPLPQFSRSGQILTWSWAANAAPNNLISSTSDHYIYFDVRIRPGTPTGSVQNCVTATGSNLYGAPVAGTCVSITVSSLARIDAIKWVRGDLDRNYNRYPRIGHTTDGGKSDYRFVLTNTGNVAFKNIVLIDIFPWVGDQIVAADFERLSEWRPSLLQPIRFYPKAAADSANVQLSPITAPASITVLYSTQKNPCRTEFSPAYNPVGCETGVWTTTPPANISATQAIKMLIPGPFAAGDTLVFGSDMRSPLGTEIDKVAWNSFAYQATRSDNNIILPVAEPNKVGIDVKRFPAIGNYVWEDLNGNGRQDEPASAGVNGVTVQLWSPGGDGERGGTDDFLVNTRVTANDGQGQPGYYRFDSLYAEPYYLRFMAPVGKGFTYQDAAGVSDSLNSDPDYYTGHTPLTTLDPNEQDFTWDAGLCTVPNAGPDLVLCAPTTAVKLANATGNNRWYALDTNPPGATIDAQTGQVTGLGAGVYQFILRSSPGCSDTVTVNRRPPAAILTPSVTLCAGESTSLTAQSAGASASYAWSGPNGYSASGQSITLTSLTTARAGSYTLTVTDGACTSTATVRVTVHTPVQLTLQPGACFPATNLYSLSGTVTLNPTGGGTLVVSDGSRSQTITVGTSQTTAAYSLTGLVSGTSTHTVTAAFTGNVCAPTTMTYTAPASCSCALSATVTPGSCQFNQTNTTTADDYFQPIVLATNTVPGASNRYEVVLNANPDGTGGTVLNPGGTTYGQSATVGNAGQFLANGLSSYRLTIRDINTPTCHTTQTLGPVAPCSSCEAVLCPKITILKRVR